MGVPRILVLPLHVFHKKGVSPTRLFTSSQCCSGFSFGGQDDPLLGIFRDVRVDSPFRFTSSWTFLRRINSLHTCFQRLTDDLFIHDCPNDSSNGLKFPVLNYITPPLDVLQSFVSFLSKSKVNISSHTTVPFRT